MAAPFFNASDGVRACAASFSELNGKSVFLKQHTSVTCTLASAAMLLRRTAMIAGYSDWEEITEENIQEKAWVNGVGLLWNFTCYDMTVGHGYFSGTDNKLSMLDLLDQYPQGIVIYNGGNQGQSHAILLTDYEEATDTFYVADPSSAAPSGRIKLEDSTILGDTQKEQIANLTSYWYVSSPSVKVSGGNYIVSGTGSSSSGSDNGQSSYDPQSDTAIFNTTKSVVNAYYVVTDESANGTALRYYPSGSSSAAEYVEKGTILYIVYSGNNNFGAQWYKTESGYYIFSGNVRAFDQYSAEIIKFRNTAVAQGKTYAVASSGDEQTPLRIEPSEGNNVVGYAKNGSWLYITESGVNTVGAAWLKTSEGYYVKASEMSAVSEGKLSGAGYSGEILSLSGSYSSQPVPDQANETELAPVDYRTTASYLNLRQSPIDGAVILSIPQNTIVSITAFWNGWGKTNYNGQEGWISLDYAVEISQDTPLILEAVHLSSSLIHTGDSVNCTVTVYGADKYFSRFRVCNDSGELVYAETLFTIKNTFDYQTQAPGSYYFYIEIKSADGRTADGYSGNFIVHDKLQLDSVKSDIEEYSTVYEPIGWTVNAVSVPDSAVYHYSLYRNDELLEETDSSVNEFTYTPSLPGTYRLCVKLVDAYEQSEELEAAAVPVFDVLRIDSIKLSATSIVMGNTVSCEIAASGGTGEYQYCFSLFKDGKLARGGALSQKNTESFLLDEDGTYAVFCAVMDSHNMIISAFSADILVLDCLLGDVDADGKITASDARIVLRYAVGLSYLEERLLAAADVNKDGSVNAADARIILRCAANIETF